MKINGVVIAGPNREEIFIPRGNQVIHVIAEGILDDSDFEKLCPRPEPPELIKAGVGKIKNIEDKNFKISLNTWASRRTAFICINSLRPTNIEWEIVKYDDPSTWTRWQEELGKVFTAPEIKAIWDIILAANGMNEERLERARQSFLVMMSEETQKGQSSLLQEPINTPSGVPANDLVSALQE
jgi:hypothetical protein